MRRRRSRRTEGINKNNDQNIEKLFIERNDDGVEQFLSTLICR